MPIDNNDIINAIKTNPEQGFRELMSRFKEPVYWHIRRLVVAHEDAQDAAQETFVRIYRSLDQYSGERSFSAWIYRIATNEALRVIERNNRRAFQTLDETTADFTADAYIDYTDVEAVKLQRAIHTLPTKQQVAFNLRYYDEMSYEGIAEVTGSTEGAAKSNYHLAKEKIVEYLRSND
jgi:RNA polymerase sigma-70 factor (ECF subfamily)